MPHTRTNGSTFNQICDVSSRGHDPITHGGIESSDGFCAAFPSCSTSNSVTPPRCLPTAHGHFHVFCDTVAHFLRFPKQFSNNKCSRVRSFSQSSKHDAHVSCHCKHVPHTNRSHVTLSTGSSLNNDETLVIFTSIYPETAPDKSIPVHRNTTPGMSDSFGAVVIFCSWPLPHCAAESRPQAGHRPIDFLKRRPIQMNAMSPWNVAQIRAASAF